MSNKSATSVVYAFDPLRTLGVFEIDAVREGFQSISKQGGRNVSERFT